MPKANTYRAERMLGPYGFSLTDVQVIDGNRKRPAKFERIGDQIDLNRVDIRTLVRSAMTGQLRNLLVGGALSTVQQEVSEAKEQEIQAAIAEFGVPSYLDHPVAIPVRYVQLEPGVTVAVANVTEAPKQVEIIQPPAPPQTVEIEPGIMGPSIVAGGQTPEIAAAPSVPESKGKKSKKVANKVLDQEPPPMAGRPPSQYAGWKLNLDFQSQKRAVLESTDLEFLKWVAAEDESIQFKKLAQTKLAEFGS